MPLVRGLALVLVLAAGQTEGPGGDGYRRSEKRIEEALRRSPDDPRLLLVLGDFKERNGRLEEALSAMEKAAAAPPRLPEAVLRAAQLRARLGKTEAASTLFREAVSRGERPVRLAARAGLSDLFYIENRHGEAAALMRESIADGDGSAEARFLLGRALEREAAGLAQDAGEKRTALLAEARRALEEAVRLDAGHPGARYVLGMLLQKEGKQAEARAELLAFRRAKSAATAAQLEEQGRRDGLIETRTLVDIARARLQAGSSPDALAAVEEALRLTPDDEEALLFGAQLFLRAGRAAEAARACERVLRARPRHPEALLGLAHARLLTGAPEEAAALALRAVEARRVYPEAIELLATLAVEGRAHAERAEEFARAALAQRPSPANFVRLAIALHAAGKVGESQEVVRQGLSRFPGHPDLVAGMGILGQGGPPRPGAR